MMTPFSFSTNIPTLPTTESAVTGKLYTRRDKFVRTQPDRATNRSVTWSSK